MWKVFFVLLAQKINLWLNLIRVQSRDMFRPIKAIIRRAPQKISEQGLSNTNSSRIENAEKNNLPKRCKMWTFCDNNEAYKIRRQTWPLAADMITNEFICQNRVNGTANTLQYTKRSSNYKHSRKSDHTLNKAIVYWWYRSTIQVSQRKVAKQQDALREWH
jgi:hypothetical protein